MFSMEKKLVTVDSIKLFSPSPPQQIQVSKSIIYISLPIVHCCLLSLVSGAIRRDSILSG